MQEAVALTISRLSAPEVVRHKAEHPALVVPLESSVVELDRASEHVRIDRASIALLPANRVARVRALSPITRLATLLIGPLARRRAQAEYEEIEERRFIELLAVPRLLPRTRWVDELVHRYVFERHVCEKHGSAAAAFLETELAKELFFACRERDERHTRASVIEEEDELVARARGWIDEHLFTPLRVAALARQCHTSESTLLRAFQRELGCTPAAYARQRRLDAALLLVQDGRHTVGEVATQVGYANLAAFTAAFHRRFGMPPSAARRQGEDLERLPPFGATPRRKRRSD
jgi:AraC-like DNA-binding protein